MTDEGAKKDLTHSSHIFYELHHQSLTLLGGMPGQDWKTVETSCQRLRLVMQKMHSLAYDLFCEEGK